MTDGQTETAASQDVSTLPKQPGDGTCGRHDDEEPPTLESENKQQARQAGEIVHDPTRPCCDCSIYRDGNLNNNSDCELCRINPEPDPNTAVFRVVQWLRQALNTIDESDRFRILTHRPLTDSVFQIEIKQALTNFNNDGERLVSLLFQPDAETLSGELSVGETLKGGGQ